MLAEIFVQYVDNTNAYLLFTPLPRVFKLLIVD
jgi:hypothetical protein